MVTREIFRLVADQDRRGPMTKCGYCGSEIDVDGEVLHLPECAAPVPYGDEDAPNDPSSALPELPR